MQSLFLRNEGHGIPKSLSCQAGVAGVPHAGLHLPLVGDVAEPLSLAWRQMQLGNM